MYRVIIILFFVISPLTVCAYDRGEELLWACTADETAGIESAL